VHIEVEAITDDIFFPRVALIKEYFLIILSATLNTQ